MKNKNDLSELSDENLIKNRNMLKGTLIGMYTICVLVTVLLLYICFSKGFNTVSFVSFITVLMLPFITLYLRFEVNTIKKLNPGIKS